MAAAVQKEDHPFVGNSYCLLLNAINDACPGSQNVPWFQSPLGDAASDQAGHWLNSAFTYASSSHAGTLLHEGGNLGWLRVAVVRGQSESA